MRLCLFWLGLCLLAAPQALARGGNAKPTPAQMREIEREVKRLQEEMRKLGIYGGTPQEAPPGKEGEGKAKEPKPINCKLPGPKRAAQFSQEAFPASPLGERYAQYVGTCALGDVDGDGDLDLAMTTLSDAQGQNTPQYVFFNEKGTLSNAKPWVSSDATPSVGALFAEMVLCLVIGAVSPTAFRLLASSKPFQWLLPVALAVRATRRRIFSEHVEQVRHKLEVWCRQANDERYVSLPADFQEGGSVPPPPGGAPVVVSSLHVPPEERIFHFLVRSGEVRKGNVLIVSPGGRGKSALLREAVRRMLEGFEEDPSRPLPVLCDAKSGTLEDAIQRGMASLPVPGELHEALLLRSEFVLVVDGLTESSIRPEALEEFIDGRYGRTVQLLLTSRPHVGFQRALENSERWLFVEPRCLDERGLELFVSAYAPGGRLAEDIKKACVGPEGTYLPILVRLTLLVGNEGRGGFAALYEAAFRALLRRGGLSSEEDLELLDWAGSFCLRTYWAHGIRSLRYRNAPEQERMRKLLQAGVLVPEDEQVKPGQAPRQVRFFHDSMQSYLTARGLFAQEHQQPTWDFLWRAAADPHFTHAQSELVVSSGSELFQMCLGVFGPEERLRQELKRQLLEWARLYDEDLRKRDIARAVPEALRPRFQAVLQAHSEPSPGRVLRVAIEVCAGELTSLGALYMHMARLLWPLQQPEQLREA